MNEPRLPQRWTDLYTRGLPDAVRAARRDEIACDVYEQCVDAADGRAARGVRVAVVGRTLRGIPGDVTWRIEEGRAVKQMEANRLGRPTGFRAAWASITQAWFTPFAALVGVFDLVAALMVALDPDGKMPGQAIGPVFLVACAAAMFGGLGLRWRAQFAPSLSPRVAKRAPVASGVLVGLGLAAMLLTALGMMASPVWMVVGIALLIVVVVAATRRRQARARAIRPLDETTQPSLLVADVLIVIGTLPAIGVFWLIVPAVLAVVVIGGVIGTGPGTRRRVAA